MVSALYYHDDNHYDDYDDYDDDDDDRMFAADDDGCAMTVTDETHPLLPGASSGPRTFS